MIRGKIWVDVLLLQLLGAELDRAAGRHLTINATGAIGALLLEIEISPDAIRSMAVISRAGGLAGHLVEERQTHAARKIWQLVEDNIPYEEPSPR
jgi:citrate synthase